MLTRLGAKVDKRIYPGMGHIVNEDEVEAARKMFQVISTDEIAR